MKLITLNLWHGKHDAEIREFLQKQSQTVDIFCFQEVCSSSTLTGASVDGFKYNFLDSLKEALPDFFCAFNNFTDRIGYEGEELPGLKMGQAFFCRKSLDPNPTVKSSFITRDLNQMIFIDGLAAWPTLLQMVELTVGGKVLRINNFHGVSQPGHKRDNEERVQASRKVLDLVSDQSVPTIVCGDFNLFPDTKSIEMFGEAGFRNLVTEYKIPSTRSTLTPHYGKPTEQKFADYIFTRGIRVEDFKALPDQISDHLALWLKFDI